MKGQAEAEHFLSQYSDAVMQHALRLRELIFQTLPGVQEQLDLPARMIGYAYGQKYSDMVCTLIPSKRGLKLGFYKGAELPDPEKLLKGSGKISRYVEINAQADLRINAFTTLLQAAYQAYRIRNSK